jgi:hypothetical protein
MHGYSWIDIHQMNPTSTYNNNYYPKIYAKFVPNYDVGEIIRAEEDVYNLKKYVGLRGNNLEL